MKVHVKLFASLKRYLPEDASKDTITLDVPEGSTVAELITQLGIGQEHAKIIVSNDEQLEVAAVLREQQEIQLYPPLAGGC